jgi:N-acetylglucosaminyldiphosphoundecaprenol N-acetyl-beta-D-mannosaminyltransferase
MGCPIDDYSFDQAVREILERIVGRGAPSVIHFLNVAKIVKARKDVALRHVLWAGDFVLPDGKPLLWFARAFGIHLPTRVNGTDLMERLLAESAQKGLHIYLLGATPEILEACVLKIRSIYPGSRICGYRDGYFGSDEIENVISEINSTRPHILFIGMPTPRKEFFAQDYRSQLNVPVIQGVGGSFDVLAGAVPRAPTWMQYCGLEWLFRVLQEPHRLFWRYFSTNTVFITIFFGFLLRHLLKEREQR